MSVSEIPTQTLTAPAKLAVPGPKSSDRDKAAWVLDAEVWMGQAIIQIEALAAIVCAQNGQKCPNADA